MQNLRNIVKKTTICNTTTSITLQVQGYIFSLGNMSTMKFHISSMVLILDGTYRDEDPDPVLFSLDPDPT